MINMSPVEVILLSMYVISAILASVCVYLAVIKKDWHYYMEQDITLLDVVFSILFIVLPLINSVLAFALLGHLLSSVVVIKRPPSTKL